LTVTPAVRARLHTVDTREVVAMGLLDKAKEAAKTVGDKAQEGIKAGQEKVDDHKTKKRISDLKEELGGIVYAQRTGAPPADADAQITRIVADIQESEASLTP
jgi:hypothetical protein